MQFLPANNAQVPSLSLDPQVSSESAAAQGQQNPSHTITDPIRYVTLGPQTIFYVSDASSADSAAKGSKSKHHGGGGGGGKKDGAAVKKFEKVTLRGREQMQTTEKTEILPLEQGGGVRRTWVCVTRQEVVSEEIPVEGKDVVAESDGDSESDSDSDSDSSGGELKKWRKQREERRKRIEKLEKENYLEWRKRKAKAERREKKGEKGEKGKKRQ